MSIDRKEKNVDKTKCSTCIYLYTDDFCLWAEMQFSDVWEELCSYSPSGEVEGEAER